MYKFPEDTFIANIPAYAFRQLTKELNENFGWRFLADTISERLPYGSGTSNLEDLTNSTIQSPAENLLFQLHTKLCTVEILCDFLEACNLLRALAVLREPVPIHIEQQPTQGTVDDAVRVSLNKFLKLQCKAEGLPPPSYAWYHNNVEIPGEHDTVLYKQIISIDQEGYYKCKVSQVDSKGMLMDVQYSEQVNVIVARCITIEKHPIPFREVVEGQSFTLECQASSHPPAKFQWFRDNTQLDGQNTNVLQIDKFSAKDEGKYYCYITSELNEAFTSRCKVIVDLPREKAIAKIALLIANESYDHQEKLKTPKNDVILLSALLEELGFKVITLLDLTATQMRNAMRIFCSALSEGVYGFFYFAGHGFKMQESYMMPIDAPECYLRTDAVCESELLAMSLPTDPALLVIVLDTCQTVPPKECNPEIHREVPKINEYRSQGNLRNLVRAYSTSSHCPSYERKGHPIGMYVAHLSTIIVQDIPVQKVFELVGKSIDLKFRGRERNQIPMFALTITKPFRFTDAIYNREAPAAVTRLNELVEFPKKIVEINFQKIGRRCEVQICQMQKRFVNSIRIVVKGTERRTVNFHNTVPVKRNNLFQNSKAKNECNVHNPQGLKGPIAISLAENGTLVGVALLDIIPHVPPLLHKLNARL